MNRKERIEQEVIKTLQCFDQMEKIKSSPLFYTRLQAKIRSLEDRHERFAFKIFSLNILRPAFLIFIVVLNLISAIYMLQGNSYQIDDRNEYISELADDYTFRQNDFNSLMAH